jgi:2-polyprenyl-6-methoxyphenol hydroxylase-like FAD-dependent oxidoreductase
MAVGSHELPWWDRYRGRTRIEHRHLATTTTPRVPSIAFYHPAMQEALVEAAASAGAEIHRGARVAGVRTNSIPTVTAEIDGRQVEIKARLVVGADGRNSRVRSWSGFDVRRNPDQNLVAGVLFDDMPVPDVAVHSWRNHPMGLLAILFPQGHERVRAYLVYPATTGHRLSEEADMPRFVEDSLKAGVETEYYSQGKAVGPLATFDGAAIWAKHPYKDGVVLVGDATVASDPSFGQGLSLTARDVRVLRDQLLEHEKWDEAGHAYAEEHDRYYGISHTFELWMTQILYETGPEADARRERVMPLWKEDPSRATDIPHSGPDQPLDEVVRRRFFGEE